MSKAKNSGIQLTKADAALVKGMLNRGDRQHDIAAWFGVNSGRIADINTRSKFSEVLMQKDQLPPAGPYISSKKTYESKKSLETVNDEIKQIIETTENKKHIFLLKEIMKKIDTITNQI